MFLSLCLNMNHAKYFHFDNKNAGKTELRNLKT